MNASATAAVSTIARASRRAPRRRTVRGWLAARGLRAASVLLRPLPVELLHRAAHLLGGFLYRAQPARRRLVRANLQRVVGYLAEHDMADARVAAAAQDGRALDALVRDAFGHYVRGYLEGLVLPSYADERRLARITADDPAAVERAFAGRHGALILIGLHFGAVEIPGLWATLKRGRRITAPMETIADTELQAYFERSRRQTGLNVIPLERASAELRGSLSRGETVALVADRAVAGVGATVQLFGAPARLPIGPAVLALESGAPVWVVATRRVGWSAYRASLESVDVPAEGTRRERLAGCLASQARAFERAVATAPEQWWTLFFPVWEDIRP